MVDLSLLDSNCFPLHFRSELFDPLIKIVPGSWILASKEGEMDVAVGLHAHLLVFWHKIITLHGSIRRSFKPVLIDVVTSHPIDPTSKGAVECTVEYSALGRY